FRELGENALYRLEGGTTTVLAYPGQPFPGGVMTQIRGAAASPDGSIIVDAWTQRGESLLRFPAGGGAPAILLDSRGSMSLPGGGSARAVWFWPDAIAIDGAGRVVTHAYLTPPGSAIVRITPGGPAEVLAREGDRLGGETIAMILAGPGVSPSGIVAF